MCGIIAYLGEKEAYPILVRGLERLEYRGYDSAGICTASKEGLSVFKKKGRVETLKSSPLPGRIGIGHTRWSTHGMSSDENAHPFLDQNQEFAVVHNGIIENYLELKEELRQKGVQFSSDTDSEVIVHLLAKYYHDNFQEAILKTVQQLQGAYAFCAMKKDSREIIGCRNGSPLVLGVGNKEYFLASDVSAIIEHTRNVVYLTDFQLARITPERVVVCDFNGRIQPTEIKEVNWNLEQAQKQGFKHFMLKEIFEQPGIIEKSLLTNISLAQKPSRIHIIACGTASYAGLLGKYLIEEVAKIPVFHEPASEFRYKELLFDKDDLVMAISQSGETADTLAAVRAAKKRGIKTLGIINVMDSTIAREVDSIIYTKAGPEIGVASTKAFTSQVLTLYQLAFHLAGKNLNPEGLVEKVQQTLALHHQIMALAQKYYHYQHFLYIGRKRNFPLALEGALKLKEISYIHAEAYAAGELKHGPIALVSEEMPTLAICPQDEVYDKTFSNIQEIKARKGRVIAIATEGDEKVKSIADEVIYVPNVDPLWYPLLVAIPLQLFAYYLADKRECDIDKPRNLAKSVTVE